MISQQTRFAIVSMAACHTALCGLGLLLRSPRS
jgi:hypothetical protein